jgi:hypothetical protein
LKKVFVGMAIWCGIGWCVGGDAGIAFGKGRKADGVATVAGGGGFDVETGAEDAK